MTLFSIIIPVYNVAPFLGKCLDSVLNQLDRDTQVILVDDGSTDGSGAICDQYAERYSFLEVIHQTNRGVAGARNTGLARASGDYLIWVDPDDWVQPDWLASIRAELEKKPVDLLLFDYLVWRKDECTERHYGREMGDISPEMALNDLIEDKRIISALWNKVMRRSLYEGIVFDEKLLLLEDYDVLHHLFMKAQKVRYLPRCLYNYRVREDGLTCLRGLDISYGSFLVACKRRNEVRATGRKCSPMGVVIQARWFCHFYYMEGSPKAFRKECRACRWAILRSAPAILREKDVGRRERVWKLIWALPGVGSVYRKVCS